jgi:hypothetical protein
MNRAEGGWQWHTVVFLLPLPFYLARDLRGRLLLGLIPWAALLLALDSAQVFFKNPYSYISFSSSRMALALMAYAGSLLLLPNFVSWIDGDGALPAWPVSFRHYSRIFFASAISWLFVLSFLSVLGMGVGLITMIDRAFRFISVWLLERFAIFGAAAFGCAFYWTAASRKLLDVLERYVLAVFSYILPFVSVFILLFLAALPLGIERLWRRGFNSGIILGLYLAAGCCAYAAWQGGADDDGGGLAPFSFKPIDILAKAALVLLPLLCPILIYTIGLRVSQYGWTIDRVTGMAISVLFGLYSTAWAFFLIKRRAWPSRYGKVNRIALPAIAAALILLSSPLCDVRRIVLNARLDMLSALPKEGDAGAGFDWRYVAVNLGSYGISAMESFAGEGGKSALAKRLSLRATDEDVRQVQEKVKSELASIKKDKENRDARRDPAIAEARRKRRLEEFITSARSAPVFGGEMDEDEKEMLALTISNGEHKNSVDIERADCFFYLTDLNGDGEKDVLFGIERDIFLIRDNRAFKLYQGSVKKGGRGPSDNKLAISADKQMIIKNEWASLMIDGRLYSLDQADADEIASADKTSRNGETPYTDDN